MTRRRNERGEEEEDKDEGGKAQQEQEGREGAKREQSGEKPTGGPATLADQQAAAGPGQGTGAPVSQKIHQGQPPEDTRPPQARGNSST